MLTNISKLKRDKFFENEKIKILFSTGEVSDSLSVYIKDEKGKTYHILWEIYPDRCSQGFDKSNDKIKSFIKDKINEWEKEEENAERLRNEIIQNKKNREENQLKRIIDLF